MVVDRISSKKLRSKPSSKFLKYVFSGRVTSSEVGSTVTNSSLV